MKKLLSILLLCLCFSATAQNTSTIQQLLDEGVTIGELLDSGITPNEFYGMEYQGGFIFELDSISQTCKVINKTQNSFNGHFYWTVGNGITDVPFFSDLADDGEFNTQFLLDYYLDEAEQSILKLTSISNLNGYTDWYLPSIQECSKFGINVYRNSPDLDLFLHQSDYGEQGPYFSCLTSNQHEENHFNLVRVADYNLNQSQYGFSQTFNTSQGLSIYMSRQFNYYNELTNPEVSPALESFLETYSPPVVEEEIVSDANSFDVLNPLSYNGEFEVINILGEYIVPEGKTLILNHGSSSIDGVLTHGNSLGYSFDWGPNIPSYLNFAFNNTMYQDNVENYDTNLKLPIIVSENKLVTGPLNGILIDKIYSSVHHNFEDSYYEVPNNHTLVITHMIGNMALIIDTAAFSFSNQGLGSINNPLYVSNSISANSGSFHGFLIDNSNYTYATDYELIDALNEGIDSISTMSEMVVLENDSISSQNAILSQENEALMATDYNFDSLQYVADFLSSQVFELQQELLVPNIDVDMAIGWNMLGFSCPEGKSANDALSNIVNDLIILKDNFGSVYLPEFGFNGIGDLTPGHGYQIKVTDFILNFNICE
jgi:hypothetical protein